MVSRTGLRRSQAARIGDRFASVNAQPASAEPNEWCKLLGGLAIVFALFQGLAHALGSDSGQAGVLVAAAVIAALVAAEGLLFGQSFRAALHSLGFGRPAGRGVIVALGLSLLLLAVLPIYAAIRGACLAAYPGWLWLLPGLFAQAGVAEEALFRGYLFGNLRRARSFCRQQRWRHCHSPLPTSTCWRSYPGLLRSRRFFFPPSSPFPSHASSSSAATPSGRRHCCISPCREPSRFWWCRETPSCRSSGSAPAR
jgi:hypothetical protein